MLVFHLMLNLDLSSFFIYYFIHHLNLMRVFLPPSPQTHHIIDGRPFIEYVLVRKKVNKTFTQNITEKTFKYNLT